MSNLVRQYKFLFKRTLIEEHRFQLKQNISLEYIPIECKL